jgi:hypothetical protein
MTNDRFAAHTRSASFALTLTSAQIEELLALSETARLAEKYPWYRPHEANFGTAEELAVHWSRSTVRALARKGLVDVVPTPPPVCRHEVVRLSGAGRLLVALLHEAGFTVALASVPPVPLHPDDRTPVVWDNGEFVAGPCPPGDRRDPADAEFLSLPRHKVRG